MRAALQRLPATTGWRQWAAAALTGAALALTQAPLNLFFLPFLAVPVIAWLAMSAPRARAAAALGWAAGLGYFGLGLNWLVEPFLVDAARTGWMAPFALFFMAAGLSLFWAAAFWLAHKAVGTFNRRVLALVVLWTLAEFARAHLFTGFPWGLIAYGWIDTPVIQLLALIGPHGLDLLTLLVAVLPLLFPDRFWRVFFVMLALVSAGWSWGIWRVPPAAQLAMTDTTVRLIQPNAAQALKWRDDMVGVFFDRQLALTRHARAEKIDVVIWPEASIPYFLGEDDADQRRVAEAAGPGTQVIAGIRRYDDGRYYNALVQFDGQGRAVNVYDKHHLVPFGEFIPFQALADRIGLSGLAAQYGGFSAGPGPVVLPGKGLPDYIPLICYEAIFPGDAEVAGHRPGWLVHLTNDAWFGGFSGPYQHLVQVRARAIEQGLPVARAANTGVSAMIGPYGRVLQSLPLGVSGRLDAVLPATLTPPPYTRFGEFPWLIGAALALAMMLWRPREREDAPHGGK